MQPINYDTLNRTAKYFMDAGRAASAEAALDILQGFSLTIDVGRDAAGSVEGQIALLTLVNLARRTLLGGVEVVCLDDEPSRTRLTRAATLREAVIELGAVCVDQAAGGRPTALIGAGVPADLRSPAWRLQWQGWRGGVTPARSEFSMAGSSIALAPVMAAAACMSEVFAHLAGDHPMAGRRDAGLSLWSPGADWKVSDTSEPTLSYLPSRLWLIGLGNLGQAYAWLLAALPYVEPSEALLLLQDFDAVAPSNDSTSLLASLEAVDIKKTRWVARWLEARGFSTLIEERRFGAWTRRIEEEPGAALCGVDNALARAALEDAGFELVLEAGLGAGPDAFRSFSIHGFPGPRRAVDIWARRAGPVGPDVSGLPAYQDLRENGMDECGLALLASRTVGVPFVGLIAGGLVIGELLRRLHGAPALDLISGSAASLADIERSMGAISAYSSGHTAACSL